MSARASGRDAFAITVLMAVIASCLYASGLNGAYFGDDYLFAAIHPVANPLRHFVDTTLLSGWYRPIEAALLTSIQSMWGLDPAPVHRLALAIHVGVIALVVGAMRSQGGGRIALLAAGGAMAITQANAMAVLSIDALSQLLSTLFGFAAILAAIRGSGNAWTRRLLAGVFLLLALLSKETGLAYLPPILAAVVLRRDGSGTMRDRVLDVVTLLALAGLFFIMRGRTEAPSLAFGTLRYQLRISDNIPSNLGLLILAVLVPGSTVWFVDALAPGHAVALAAMTLGAATVAIGTLVGMRFSEQRGRALAWLACAALVVGPLLLLNHVSELYAYAALPMLALVFGFAAEGWWNRARGAGRVLLAAGLIALAAIHGAAIVDKARMMARNGSEATRLLSAVNPWVAHVPPGASLWLVHPDAMARGYSVYRLQGFRPIEFSERWLRERHQRPDLQVEVLTESEARRRTAPAGTIVLEWRNGQVAERTR